ncbi:MAG: SH3 domain-containing protein [Proteobacteria bacterium]|nr:SH3 domain-containing protein [Desulfobacteraceae bacterium]MBU2520977.1 SH3 domain-containing protein [Pseudomonadota bacterium]MBU3981852.1 SH3 domain-containing protein [Pseudomonadota bacterium]MBU4012505.1 SH3 domain-containing protein [Pseudomonadota bacterium]MBU4067567.1 SH3 domain-containing protein [Pseudomonadota bacterium]
MRSRASILIKACSIASISIALSIIFSSIAFAERLTIISSIANIRSGPGNAHDILWKVGKYHPILVLKKSGNWYHFQDFEGDKGWIHKSLVSNIPSVITNNEKCNVRSGPDTKFEILFTIKEGIPFKILKRKGNWIYVQHADGDTGWIHKSLVW